MREWGGGGGRRGRVGRRSKGRGMGWEGGVKAEEGEDEKGSRREARLLITTLQTFHLR